MHIVMTGGTAGIGLHAARALLATGNNRLVVGVRDEAKARFSLGPRPELAQLDLADLESVRRFAETIGPFGPIDALVLNAGLQTTSLQRSAQGYELTFATNHLAHYLLARLLLPAMAPGGRIILTSSGLHDPEMKAPMPPPRHADSKRLAFPGEDPARDVKEGVAGRRAYAASKLCNLMTARELAVRLSDDPRSLMVAAFDPAFTPGTGLARHYPAWADWLFRRILPIVVRGPLVSTPACSGGWLAALAADPAYAASRGDYWSVRSKRLVAAQPSQLARNADAARRLWDDSAALVGLPAELRYRMEATEAA
jgi:NAD(P)-dependent dehydrogenase (short-subunit alcohol dehydrogenase family)